MSVLMWPPAGGVPKSPPGQIATPWARFRRWPKSASRAFGGGNVRIRAKFPSDESRDFRSAAAPQIGPPALRLGPPGPWPYLPRVAAFDPGILPVAYDLGMLLIIPLLRRRRLFRQA